MTLPISKKWLGGIALSCALAGAAQATELLNSSYDVSRELFVALNAPFEKQWDAAHPNDKLTIKQSHAGSSKQALAILHDARFRERLRRLHDITKSTEEQLLTAALRALGVDASPHVPAVDPPSVLAPAHV